MLENLTVYGILWKAKLRVDPEQHRWSTLDFCVALSDTPTGGPGVATENDILKSVPGPVAQSHAAMSSPEGAIEADFPIHFDSMNVSIMVSPKARPALKLVGVPITGLKLQKIDPQDSPLIAMHFSLTAAFTRELSEFLVSSLGTGLWLKVSECQMRMNAA